jgi:hypothetical protein
MHTEATKQRVKAVDRTHTLKYGRSGRRSG